MKKIFTILGTMIIIGHSLSTVIIINSDKKEQVKNLKNSKMDFEKNKLEKLNRIKRQTTPPPLYWHSNPGPSRINLSNVIASADLGMLSNNDQATILEQISEQNPNLDTTQIQINFTRFNEDGTQLWTISAREDSQMYFGEQNVRFSIRPNLCDFLSQQDLTNILLIPLCLVVKNTDLGVLPNANRETILQRIAEQNPNLDTTRVRIGFYGFNQDGTQSWQIRPLKYKQIYFGAKTIRFSVRSNLCGFLSQQDLANILLIPLCTVIRNNNLGVLPNANRETILQRIVEQNPHLDITQVRINFTRFNEDGTQSWEIRPKKHNQIYFGTKTIRLSIKLSLCNSLSQQDLANILLIPLCTVIKNTDLGVLPNEDQATILKRLADLNPNLDITQVVAHFTRIDDNGTFIWIIAPSENSIYTSVIQVYCRINPNLIINHIQIPEININVEKQKKLNKINFEPLSENEKRSFKETLQRIGTAAIRAGIIPVEAKLTANVMPPVNTKHELGGKEVITSSLISAAGLVAVSKTTGLSPINDLKTIANYFRYNLASPPLETTAETAQVTELAPLLSSGSGETAILTVGEGAIIGTETTVSATLAPETLGLSVLIGLLIVGTTSLIWWLNDSSSQLIRNKSHSQYNEIEKYYKFFHDQLKIGINLSKWKKISQIYYQYYNNYQKFSHMVKKEIINFYREDHSGWGGSINENDIDILIKVLFNNFNEINNKFVINSVEGWKIVTNTNGSYFLME